MVNPVGSSGEATERASSVAADEPLAPIPLDDAPRVRAEADPTAAEPEPESAIPAYGEPPTDTDGEPDHDQGRSDRARDEPLPHDMRIALPTPARRGTDAATATATPNLRVDASEPRTRPADIYEWEILIEAPFAFDFFKMVRSLFGIPERLRVSNPGGHERTSRRRWYLHVALYNVGRLALILGMIPFLMLAFSYIATLPFLLLRGLSAWLGMRAMTFVAALGLIVCLSVPVLIILSWFRPMAYRDAYKRSKVELINILWALALFLASSMLEFLIASPHLPIRRDYTGSLESTPQWTLFFADKAMNVLFANLPQKLFGPISDIHIREGGSEVSLGLLRLLLIFGFVALVRMMAMKLCVSKKELFYGTVDELRSYLDFCGKAEARTIRKVIPIHDDELVEIRTKARERSLADEAD